MHRHRFSKKCIHTQSPISLHIGFKWISPLYSALLLAFAVGLLAAPSAEAGNRVSSCGGLNQVPCNIFQAIPSCDTTIPWLYENFSQNRCRALGCGAEGQSPCTVTQHIPSCNPGLYEIPLGARCTALDSDGFPTICGGTNERPCSVTEHIPSCKSNHFEYPFPGGNCTALDSDGFPTFCGGVNESACTVDLQLQVGISSCKTSLVESDGQCVETDLDLYPTNCGDRLENACNLAVQILLGITSCKAGLVEDLTDGVCYLPDDLFPVGCGDPGERACGVLEHLPSCKSTAYEITSGALPLLFMGWCVDREVFPTTRSTSMPEEAPPGPKSVFLIHGLGSDRSGFSQFDVLNDDPSLGITRYFVDYNSNGEDVTDGLRIYHDGGDPICEIGTRLDGFTFSLRLVSRLLAAALSDQENCRIPGFVPGPESVALVAHSMGGLVARDLVYHSFESLLSEEIRITDVVTLGSPHRGGGAGFPEVADGQAAACIGAVANPRVHQVCLMERWQDALQEARQEANALGAPFIDNLDFPEIRWTTVAAADSTVETSVDYLTFSDPITRHDGLVAHVSSFSIASDLCFPAVDGAAPPSILTDRSVPHIGASAAWFDHLWPFSVVLAWSIVEPLGDYDYNPWNGFNLGPMNQVTLLSTTDEPNSLTSQCHSPGPSKAYPDRSYLDPDIAPEAVADWAAGLDRFVAFPNTAAFLDSAHGDLVGSDGDSYSEIAIGHYVKTVLTDGLRTADVDRNGIIDSADRNLILAAFPEANPLAPSAYFLDYPIETDLDGDGFTTQLDLEIFYQAVPEPGLPIAVMVGALGLACAGFRRMR